jgi:hypothetical protein
MYISNEMLAQAIKKAVEVGLIPNMEVDIDTYMKIWDAMKAILEAAINVST